MRILRRGMLTFAVAALVAACGGGGGSNGTPTFNSVVVFGDSLSDVGTFGLKFTVQKASDRAAGYPIWPQLVANAVGVNGGAQCNFYTSSGATFGRNTAVGCTNYAIGGGRIVNTAAQGGSASPLTVSTQMLAHTAVGYTPNTLVLIDGGGNDAADLAGAYLGAAQGAAGVAAYQAFLLQQLDAATLSGLFAKAGGAENAAGAYMDKLADTFYASVRNLVLSKGATNVVILNLPDITLTPRFQAVLYGVSKASGAAAAAAVKGGIQAWISAYNAKLKTLAAGDPRVVVVDFYGAFTAQVANPSSLGLTDAVNAVCPVVGLDGSGLPSYSFPTCTDTALDTLPGKTAGWWKTFSFSDGFHPTPRGHELMADSVLTAARGAGWVR